MRSKSNATSLPNKFYLVYGQYTNTVHFGVRKKPKHGKISGIPGKSVECSLREQICNIYKFT